jgi:hypothetical protein
VRVSLCSNTVQPHDGLSSRRAYPHSEASFSSQNGDHAWAVLRSAVFSCAFNLWAETLKVKDNHKEMLSVYGGKCSSRKVVHNRTMKPSQELSKIAIIARTSVEVGETTEKILLCCEFRRTGKSVGQVCQCWWRICRELYDFPRFMLYVLYRF